MTDERGQDSKGEISMASNVCSLEQQAPLRVGCALLPKKVSRYLTPHMLRVAAANNIELVTIDYTRSLLQQGPFNLILHKLRPCAVWEHFLQEYKAAHPEVCIVDRLDRIAALHNRATMLTPLKGQGITLLQPLANHQQQQQQCVRVQAPLQVEIPEGASEADAQAALAAAGLAPPLLCKPLWTDGREGSHGLAVLHDLEALGRLMRGAVSSEFKPPLVVQQFVEHGGVLFKVYVLGEQTVVTARPSLGDTVLESEQGVQQLPRISCVSVFGKQLQQQQQQERQRQQQLAAVTSAANGSAVSQQQQQQQQQQQPAHAGSPPRSSLAAAAAAWKPPPTAPSPPDWVTSSLAATLRQELGMQLFNFDLLIPEQQAEQQQPQGFGGDSAPPLCYVVDINYFPGVDKIPNFEQCFVKFLRAAAEAHLDSQQQQQQQQPRHQQHAVVSPQQPPPSAAASPAPPIQQASAAPAAAAAAAPAAAAAAAKGAVGSPVPAAVGPCCMLHRSYSSSSGSAGSAAAGSYGVEQQHLSPHRHHHQQHHHRRSHPGVDAAAAAAGQQWVEGVLGSSPPQLQVAGCS